MALALVEALVPVEVPHGYKPTSTAPNWKEKRKLVSEARSKETKVDCCLLKPRQPVSVALWLWLMFALHWNSETVDLDKCRWWSSRSC
jgi:hypothetical protein